MEGLHNLNEQTAGSTYYLIISIHFNNMTYVIAKLLVLSIAVMLCLSSN